MRGAWASRRDAPCFDWVNAIRAPQQRRFWCIVFTLSTVILWNSVSINNLSWDPISDRPVCSQSSSERWRMQKFVLPLPALAHVGSFEELADRYGHVHIWAATSSKTREDTTDGDDGGLDEERVSFGTFLARVAVPSVNKYDYIKILDRPSFESLEEIGLGELVPLGQIIDLELRRALLAEVGIHAPVSACWSLWVGGNGSTTSLHVDDVAFNMLVVLRGAKRVVLVDPERQSFLCEKPRLNPFACWAGIDVLSGPAPAFAQEVILRSNEAILLPEMWWHAVENLEPTIAVGLNEMQFCTGSRFAQLRSPLARVTTVT